MKIHYYLRYSNNIIKDVLLGHSFHYTGLDKDFDVNEIAESLSVNVDNLVYSFEAKQYVQVLDGLCAFELLSDNLEDAILEASCFFYNDTYNSCHMHNWHILSGRYVDDGLEGVLIDPQDILYSNAAI